MTTINVSLPDSMKEWVEEQALAGQYRDAAEYIQALISQEQEQQQRIQRMQKLVDAGRASGVSEASMDDIEAKARAQLQDS